MRRACCWFVSALLFWWFLTLLLIGVTIDLQRVVAVLAGVGSALCAGAGRLVSEVENDA